MKTFTIAFDVDGTLIGERGSHENILTLLKILAGFKNVRVIVWSGGGKEYAESYVRRLDLEKYVKAVYSKVACEEEVHIAIDDIHEFNLGHFNLIVRNK